MKKEVWKRKKVQSVEETETETKSKKKAIEKKRLTVKQINIYIKKKIKRTKGKKWKSKIQF